MLDIVKRYSDFIKEAEEAKVYLAAEGISTDALDKALDNQVANAEKRIEELKTLPHTEEEIEFQLLRIKSALDIRKKMIPDDEVYVKAFHEALDKQIVRAGNRIAEVVNKVCVVQNNPNQKFESEINFTMQDIHDILDMCEGEMMICNSSFKKVAVALFEKIKTQMQGQEFCIYGSDKHRRLNPQLFQPQPQESKSKKKWWFW